MYLKNKWKQRGKDQHSLYKLPVHITANTEEMDSQRMTVLILSFLKIHRLFSSVIGDTCHCRWSAQRTARGSQPLAASRWLGGSERARGWRRRTSETCRPTSPVSRTSSSTRSPHSSEMWSAPGPGADKLKLEPGWHRTPPLWNQ